MSQPLTREDLAKAFAELDRQPLRASRVFMNQRDAFDMGFMKPCPCCGAAIPMGVRDCREARVQEVMDS